MTKDKGKWPDGKITSDWYACAGLAHEMQQHGNYAISIDIRPVGRPEKPDWLLRATAVPMDVPLTEVARSASASVTASSSGMVNWTGLLTFLLYQLDFVASSIGDEPAEGA